MHDIQLPEWYVAKAGDGDGLRLICRRLMRPQLYQPIVMETFPTWSLQNKTRVHAAIKTMKEVGETPVLIIYLSASSDLPRTMILKFQDFLLNDRPATQIRIRHVLVFVPEDVASSTSSVRPHTLVA